MRRNTAASRASVVCAEFFSIPDLPAVEKDSPWPFPRLRALRVLREADLKRIATSRSVAGAVSAAAKREMQKKQG